MKCPDCGTEMVCDVYKTTSRWGKAGSPKMIPLFKQLPEHIDNWEAEYQLNRYRVMLQDLGVKVARMILQVTVRDGGLMVAHGRGVDKNIYKIEIPIVEDIVIREYFETKRRYLEVALDGGIVVPCSSKENWDGVRCAKYCDVSSYCPQGKSIDMNNMEVEE